MWNMTVGDYLRRKLWFRVECPGCKGSKFFDPKDLITRYGQTRETRPDRIIVAHRCGYRGWWNCYPVCMLEFRPPARVEHVTMERIDQRNGVLCIVCLRCKQERRISPEEWQDAGRAMDRPLGTWRYLCQRCIGITGRRQPYRLEIRHLHRVEPGSIPFTEGYKPSLSVDAWAKAK